MREKRRLRRDRLSVWPLRSEAGNVTFFSSALIFSVESRTTSCNVNSPFNGLSA